MNFSIGGARRSRDDDINNDERRSSNNRLTYAQSAKLENNTLLILDPKNNHIGVNNISEESSKYSGIVGLDGLQLVEKFLDSEKWINLFPTIVTKEETTKVLETGSPENRDGALLLMKEEMHILSPLVRPREFNIIRYCKQVDAGVWVITDVSFDSS
ncbi:homeobox-leucine zipper protein HDG11 [Trifolium repens]|nr:homeobox-leucine zipper protein HDG11 [Trifolium repens]